MSPVINKASLSNSYSLGHGYQQNRTEQTSRKGVIEDGVYAEVIVLN